MDSADNSIIVGQSIFVQATLCRNLFVDYLAVPRAYGKVVSECQHRFSTWTKLLGVFANEKASLDYRLQRSPEVQVLVLTMLQVLERNLARGELLSSFEKPHSSSSTIVNN